MGDANRQGMGEGGVATMTFNRNNFITMNGSRLFTAKDVCDIVRDEVNAERERINDKLDYIRHTESKDEFFVTVYLFEVRKIVRGEP